MLERVRFLEKIQKELNKKSYSSNDLISFATAFLNAILLDYIDDHKINDLSDNSAKLISSLTNAILNELKRSLYLTSYVYISKDPTIVNEVQEQYKETNLTNADEIDEIFSTLKKKLNIK